MNGFKYQLRRIVSQSSDYVSNQSTQRNMYGDDDDDDDDYEDDDDVDEDEETQTTENTQMKEGAIAPSDFIEQQQVTRELILNYFTPNFSQLNPKCTPKLFYPETITT